MFCVPSSLGVMVLITNLNWRNLTNEVVSRKNAKNDLVVHNFGVSEFFEFWFGSQVVYVVGRLIGLLLYWHHSFYIICLSQFTIFWIFHKRRTQSRRPYILGSVVHTYGLSPRIFQSIVDGVRPPHLSDDGIGVLNFTFKLTWVHFEYFWLFIKEILVVFLSIWVQDIELLHYLLRRCFIHFGLGCS